MVRGGKAFRAEIYNRVYKIVKQLRESGMNYEEIQDFWKGCIEESKNKKSN